MTDGGGPGGPAAEVLERTLADLRADPDVLGVLLVGSWARGDALRGSDVDLEVLVRTPSAGGFRAHREGEVLVEVHRLDAEAWRRRLRSRPMALYAFRDGRVLHQRDGALDALARLAGELWAGHRWSDDQVRATLHWLESARVKVRAASEEGDALRAALIVSTSLWKTLEALWIVNGLPMPPVGGLLAHLPDLERTPPDFEAEMEALLLGESSERLMAGLRLMDWAAGELRARVEQGGG